jgi:hypothetical protein
MKKRFFTLVVAVVMIFALSAPIIASAASESDIISDIKKGVTVDGQKKAIPSHFVAFVQKYLDANDLTSEQADSVIAAIDDARAYWEATGKVNFAQMTKAEQQALIDKAIAAAKALGGTLTYDGNIIKVVDPNGEVFTLDLSDDVIKQTGGSMIPVSVVCGLIALLGAAFAVAGRKRLFASSAA